MASEQKAAIAKTLEIMKLTVESVFVPFSQSRNKAEGHKTLNWKVTIKRDGRVVMTVDYSAGIAYCPGYAATKAPSTFQPHCYRSHNGQPYPGTTSAIRTAKPHEALQQYKEAICAAECEQGFPCEIDPWGRGPENVFKRKAKAAPILPDPVDVMYSVTMDSNVLDYGGFEQWADEYGYDSDSKKAESIYRECLEQALKMRAAIGESGLGALKTAFEDY